MKKLDFDLLVTLQDYLGRESRTTRRHVEQLAKNNEITRWSQTELVDRFPNTLPPRFSKYPPNTYFYHLHELHAAIEQPKVWRPAVIISERTRNTLANVLRQAHIPDRMPKDVHPVIKAYTAKLGHFTKTVTLGVSDALFLDAFSFLLHKQGTKQPSWQQTFRRLIGVLIVRTHPAMAGQDREHYLKWVMYGEYDLLALLAALGYDDIQTFVTELMAPIKYDLGDRSPETIDACLTAISDRDPHDIEHKLQQAELKMELANAYVDRELGSLGLTNGRDALLHLIQVEHRPLAEIVDTLRTMKILRANGLRFDDGQVTIANKQAFAEWVETLQPEE